MSRLVANASHPVNNHYIPNRILFEQTSYKGNNGSEKEAGHRRYYRTEKTTMVWPRQKGARGENNKINYGLDTTGEKEKQNVDGRSTSSHDNKKFRTRSMEKQESHLVSGRRRQLLKKTGQIDRKRK